MQASNTQQLGYHPAQMLKLIGSMASLHRDFSAIASQTPLFADGGEHFDFIKATFLFEFENITKFQTMNELPPHCAVLRVLQYITANYAKLLLKLLTFASAIGRV
jgi:hypothetical protein